jgi:hypothetical protein
MITLWVDRACEVDGSNLSAQHNHELLHSEIVAFYVD